VYRKEGREGNTASLHNCAANRMTFKKTVALHSYFPAWSGRKLCPSQWGIIKEQKRSSYLARTAKKAPWSFATREGRMQVEEGCGIRYNRLLSHVEHTAGWLLRI